MPRCAGTHLRLSLGTAASAVYRAQNDELGATAATKGAPPRGIMEVQGLLRCSCPLSSDLGMHLTRVAIRCGSKPPRLDTRSVPRLAVGGRIHQHWQVRGPTSAKELRIGSRSQPCRGFHLSIHMADSRVRCVLGSPESATHTQVLSFAPRITDARAH